MTMANWLYATTCVMAAVLGMFAVGWGLWLLCVKDSFRLSSSFANYAGSQRVVGFLFVGFGALQVLLRGVVARGFSVPPLFLLILWSLVAASIAANHWQSTGTAIYGMFALSQLGLVCLVNVDGIAEAWHVAVETARRLRRGGH